VLASNRAAVRYFAEGRPKTPEVTFGELLELGTAGDTVALAALGRMATHLGAGIRMITAALAPREIIVVGDCTTAWELFGPTVLAEMKKHSLSRVPALRPALDGNAARLRSAVALVFGEVSAWAEA
jgi:predicted NBD/HSP70 family sugar kinase